MSTIDALLSEMEAWRRPGTWCTPREFADILARPETEFSLANQELLQGPDGGVLLQIIQTLYYVSHETDEGRTLAFNLVFRSPLAEEQEQSPWGIAGAFNSAFKYWRFQESLPFNLQEIRRLAVCNPDTSAIWIETSGAGADPSDISSAQLEIRGLALLGQKWMDSIQSLSYEYANRETPLIFRVEGPGWIEVYLGSRFYARLKAGTPQIALPRSIKDKNVLNYLVKDGLKCLKGAIKTALPSLDALNPRDGIYFAEYSYYSVILAIVNSIQRLKHGGTLILTSRSQKQELLSHLKLKYPFEEQEHVLKELYLSFMTSMTHGLALRQAQSQAIEAESRNPGAAAIDKPRQDQVLLSHLKRKYPFEEQERVLKELSLSFMTSMTQGLAFHQAQSQTLEAQNSSPGAAALDKARQDQAYLSPQKRSEFEVFYHRVNQAHKSLVECCQLVGGFSSTDGAIVLDTSLDTLGFSAEILLETLNVTDSNPVINKLSGHLLADRQFSSEVLDLKHMGMRHRSAAKLCAAVENIAVFVVSQDGGVSLIWNKRGEVFYWEDFRTKNMPFDLLPTLFDAEREVFGDIVFPEPGLSSH